ncbi:uncharacterized protein LOC119108823 [Pollicipes pollicipes]|uniref:uncharacterized protein LOC119108823 n=1 Tax=Pollicipes pollicipes TaxID=41117 RepID=UPI00188578E6|nr:uncharacterized protein LOC119108823 [Pollicipes pollicipes]
MESKHDATRKDSLAETSTLSMLGACSQGQQGSNECVTDEAQQCSTAQPCAQLQQQVAAVPLTSVKAPDQSGTNELSPRSAQPSLLKAREMASAAAEERAESEPTSRRPESPARSEAGSPALLARHIALLIETEAGTRPRSSDIGDAVCPVEPDTGAPRWRPPPIQRKRRQQLFAALRLARSDPGNPRNDDTADGAIGRVMHRLHPALYVERMHAAPHSLYGSTTVEEFLRSGGRPVHVVGDLFLAPTTIPRATAKQLIRHGQYYRGHSVACFYAYLYAFEFLFFIEYLRQVTCHDAEVRQVLDHVIDKAQSMHLIINSATLFSLIPEAMFTQRSPFRFMARLFPMEEPWEVDLLCDMINCRDITQDAMEAFASRQHFFFSEQRDMCRRAREAGQQRPIFHPRVLAAPDSSNVFDESLQAEWFFSHGMIVFGERGTTYSGLRTHSRHRPLCSLGAETVLKGSVGRHALVRLHHDVYMLGAPLADLRLRQCRYPSPAEVRVHVEIGFFVESQSFAQFVTLRPAQGGLKHGKALKEAVTPDK